MTAEKVEGLRQQQEEVSKSGKQSPYRGVDQNIDVERLENAGAVVVLDTNIIVSSAISPSVNSASIKAYKYAVDNCKIVYSKDTLAELESVLMREKVIKCAGIENIQEFLLSYKQHASCVDVIHHIRDDVVAKDLDDKKFIELSMSAKAEYLITGDAQHLLPIKYYQGVQIVRPDDFLKLEAAAAARQEQEAKWREQADRIWEQQEAERKAREVKRQEDARKAESEMRGPQQPEAAQAPEPPKSLEAGLAVEPQRLPEARKQPEVNRAAVPPQAPQPAQQPEAAQAPEPPKSLEAGLAVEPQRLPEARKQPETARQAEPQGQPGPVRAPSKSKAGKFWRTVRHAAEPAEPNQVLSRDADEIRLAYLLGRSGPGFAAALKERGFGLAQVSAEDARQSVKEFESAEAKKYSPPLREGELVAVNKRGDVYTLTPRILGDERAEIDKRLATIDRAALPDVVRAKAKQNIQHREPGRAALPGAARVVETSKQPEVARRAEPQRQPERTAARKRGGRGVAGLAGSALDGLASLFEGLIGGAAKSIEGRDSPEPPPPEPRETSSPETTARETPEELVRRLEEEERIKRREALARQYAQSVVRERESGRDLDDEGGRTR